MKIAIASDHAGLELKSFLISRLQAWSISYADCGVHDATPSDYPDAALAVGLLVQSQQVDRGVLVCGSGVGVSVAANKMAGVRASVCHDCYSAQQGVEHDAMNVLCLGARIIGTELAGSLLKAFLDARFSDEARHRRRLEKVLAIEEGIGWNKAK